MICIVIGLTYSEDYVIAVAMLPGDQSHPSGHISIKDYTDVRDLFDFSFLAASFHDDLHYCH